MKKKTKCFVNENRYYTDPVYNISLSVILQLFDSTTYVHRDSYVRPRCVAERPCEQLGCAPGECGNLFPSTLHPVLSGFDVWDYFANVTRVTDIILSALLWRNLVPDDAVVPKLDALAKRFEGKMNVWYRTGTRPNVETPVERRIVEASARPDCLWRVIDTSSLLYDVIGGTRQKEFLVDVVHLTPYGNMLVNIQLLDALSRTQRAGQ